MPAGAPGGLLASLARHRTAIALAVAAVLVLGYLLTADDLNGLLGGPV
jgi:hypothetical protein